MTSSKVQDLKDMAHKLRIHSIESTTAANSGHPTSCSSIAEIMSVLFFEIMKYDARRPEDPSADRFVLSKGHAAPILYAAWAEAGYLDPEDLKTLRLFDSDLDGHPTPPLKFVDVATGSLGQGLSAACGMAYMGKYVDKASYKVYCIMGDGETAEGSVWEAFAFSTYYKLSNLCVIIDCNRLGQSEETAVGHNCTVYRDRIEAFGLNAVIVDGHSVEKLMDAFAGAQCGSKQATCIIAKTCKGKHFPEIENKDGYHGKPLGDKSAEVIKHIKSLMSNPDVCFPCVSSLQLRDSPCSNIHSVELGEAPCYKIGDCVPIRIAYGKALAKLVKSCCRTIALDADVKNSTYSEMVKQVNPNNHIECFIAEQNMVGVATGLSARNRAITFSSTFAAFLTRAFDQIRMAAISRSNINLCGSHCGVSIGEDGPSQMGLEDIAMFRSVPNCTVFYPADAVSCEKAVELAAKTKCMCYIRTTRGATKVIYPNNEDFQIGKAKVVKRSDNDQLLIIGGGITLQESIAAAEELEEEGIHVRVLDLFTIKPIDKRALMCHAKDCKFKILTVEDHYPEGGIGEAVMSQVAEDPNIVVSMIAVGKIAKSGTPLELMDCFGLSAQKIKERAKALATSNAC